MKMTGSRRRTLAIGWKSAACVALVSIAVPARRSFGDQFSTDASEFPFRSSGSAAGKNVTLSENGYLATYIRLSEPAEIKLAVEASGVGVGGRMPQLDVVVDDFQKTYETAEGTRAYSSSVALPAGTHFVRLEYANHSPSDRVSMITLRSFTVSGATLANAATDENALAASNTYIEHFRKGDAHVTLTGPGNVPLLQGTQVHLKLVRNAFNFGCTLSGAGHDDPKDMLGVADPAAGSEQQKFQDFVKRNFNMIVPSNGAKWAYTEPTRGKPDMSLPDRQLDWAISNHKRARMHNLLWGASPTSGRQQPEWVNDLIAKAAGGDGEAKAKLRAAISDRIKYYNGTDGNRSRKYVEIDGLNESLHHPSYLNIFGDAGLADIYNELDAAIAAAGSDAKTYLNEYNVLQYAPESIDPATGKSTGFDPYANYYRRHIDALREAGGKLGGVGVQYYVNFNQTGENKHSAATMQKGLANLSVPGLPISLTEFGGTNSMKLADNAAGVQVLDDAMRMVFGTPAATTFVIWGWWDLPTNPTPPAALLDNTKGNAELTPMGRKWEELMSQFSTDLKLAVGAKGELDFKGYYGEYNVGDVGAFSNLLFTKGTTNYAIKLASPPGWSMLDPKGASTDWMAAATWKDGVVPDEGGLTAHFSKANAPTTVTLNSAVALGQFNFEGPNAYTIIGSGAVALQAASGNAAMNVITGSHTIEVPVSLQSDAQADIHGPDSTLILRALAESPMQSLAKRGEGTLVVEHLCLNSLAIEAGSVRLWPISNGGVNTVHSLMIQDRATLDIGDSTLFVEDATVAEIRWLIANGRIIGGGAKADGQQIVAVVGPEGCGVRLAANVRTATATCHPPRIRP